MCWVEVATVRITIRQCSPLKPLRCAPMLCFDGKALPFFSQMIQFPWPTPSLPISRDWKSFHLKAHPEIRLYHWQIVDGQDWNAAFILQIFFWYTSHVKLTPRSNFIWHNCIEKCYFKETKLFLYYQRHFIRIYEHILSYHTVGNKLENVFDIVSSNKVGFKYITKFCNVSRQRFISFYTCN